jgi:hypothetical protein
MKGRFRRVCEWVLLAGFVAGASLAVARAQPAEPPHYVALDPVVAPVYIDNRAAGLLAVRVSIRTDSAESSAYLQQRAPRLVDAYTSALTGYARLHVDPAAPLDIGEVEAVLERATARTVAAPGARVLIQEAMARPL